LRLFGGGRGHDWLVYYITSLLAGATVHTIHATTAPSGTPLVARIQFVGIWPVDHS
jgi:hypothetical protein